MVNDCYCVTRVASPAQRLLTRLNEN